MPKALRITVAHFDGPIRHIELVGLKLASGALPPYVDILPGEDAFPIEITFRHRDHNGKTLEIEDCISATDFPRAMASTTLFANITVKKNTFEAKDFIWGFLTAVATATGRLHVELKPGGGESMEPEEIVVTFKLGRYIGECTFPPSELAEFLVPT